MAGTYLGNSFHNICSHHDGVLLVEDTGWKDSEYAREDGIQLGSLLLMLLDLQGGQQVSGKVHAIAEQPHVSNRPDRSCCTLDQMPQGQSHLFAVGCELVKEVIDDVSPHDPDALLVCELLCFPGDRHVKCQDDAKLLAALQMHSSALVPLTDH